MEAVDYSWERHGLDTATPQLQIYLVVTGWQILTARYMSKHAESADGWQFLGPPSPRGRVIKGWGCWVDRTGKYTDEEIYRKTDSHATGEATRERVRKRHFGKKPPVPVLGACQ